MGLGGQAPEWDEYDWILVPPARLPAGRPEPRTGPPSRPRPAGGSSTRPSGRAAAAPAAAPPKDVTDLREAVRLWVEQDPVWAASVAPTLLLVDLDNLRAGRVRWQDRITALAALARRFDHVTMAGQHDAVRRARPHLGDLIEHARAVDDGQDLADHVLLDAAKAIPARQLRVMVVSNDGIFATLKDRGPLTVLSPDYQALSDQLRARATRLADLASMEREVTNARRRVGRRRRSTTSTSPSPATAGR
ncbi:hypothetical protein [Oryzihumus sp.]